MDKYRETIATTLDCAEENWRYCAGPASASSQLPGLTHVDNPKRRLDGGFGNAAVAMLSQVDLSFRIFTAISITSSMQEMWLSWVSFYMQSWWRFVSHSFSFTELPFIAPPSEGILANLSGGKTSCWKSIESIGWFHEAKLASVYGGLFEAILAVTSTSMIIPKKIEPMDGNGK